MRNWVCHLTVSASGEAIPYHGLNLRKFQQKSFHFVYGVYGNLVAITFQRLPAAFWEIGSSAAAQSWRTFFGPSLNRKLAAETVRFQKCLV
jgi:hypothetical protein